MIRRARFQNYKSLRDVEIDLVRGPFDRDLLTRYKGGVKIGRPTSAGQLHVNGQARDRIDGRELRESVARRTNPDELCAACPAGFKPFRDELIELAKAPD